MNNCRIRRKSPRLGAGFTLVEIMVVLAIIAIIAALAIPNFQVSVMQGRLQDAKPHMLRVAAAARANFNRTGVRWPNAAVELDEQNIEDTLGVNLADAADFCISIRTVNYVTDTGAPDFEVWAALRGTNYSGGTSANDSVAITGGGNCITADTKTDATGWVDNNAAAGSEGRVITYRYPSPDDGFDTGSRFGINEEPNWSAGFNDYDAILD